MLITSVYPTLSLFVSWSIDPSKFSFVSCFPLGKYFKSSTERIRKLEVACLKNSHLGVISYDCFYWIFNKVFCFDFSSDFKFSPWQNLYDGSDYGTVHEEIKDFLEASDKCKRFRFWACYVFRDYVIFRFSFQRFAQVSTCTTLRWRLRSFCFLRSMAWTKRHVLKRLAVWSSLATIMVF